MESSIEASDLWKKYPGVTIARGTGLFTHHRIDRGRIHPEPTRARGPPLRIDRGRKHPGAPRARGADLGIDRERKHPGVAIARGADLGIDRERKVN